MNLNQDKLIEAVEAFESYDPRLPEYLQLVVIRVYAKDLDIAGIEQSVIQFNAVIDKKLSELKQAA